MNGWTRIFNTTAAQYNQQICTRLHSKGEGRGVEGETVHAACLLKLDAVQLHRVVAVQSECGTAVQHLHLVEASRLTASFGSPQVQL